MLFFHPEGIGGAIHHRLDLAAARKKNCVPVSNSKKKSNEVLNLGTLHAETVRF
jgi:hypothetical protein